MTKRLLEQRGRLFLTWLNGANSVHSNPHDIVWKMFLRAIVKNKFEKQKLHHTTKSRNNCHTYYEQSTRHGKRRFQHLCTGLLS